jgi:hypothetical protein
MKNVRFFFFQFNIQFFSYSSKTVSACLQIITHQNSGIKKRIMEVNGEILPVFFQHLPDLGRGK